MNDNIDSLKAFQNLMNDLGRPIGSRDIGLKWLLLFSSGAERAVMITVAPPCRKRSATGLPAPFVPPVTKMRLPLNSPMPGVVWVDVVMLLFSSNRVKR